MAETTSNRSRKNSPLNFRMPATLRSRLRRFADERNLGESEALRLVLSERLNEIDDERGLARAERWQFEQAYATWQQFKEGKGTLVTKEEVERVFESARSPKPRARRGAR